MKKLKKILLGIIAALMLVALAACSLSSKDDSLQKIKNKGKIVVAMNPEFAPFEFKTLVNGKDTIVGADVEIAKAIAKELGVKVEFSAMSFNNVLSSVQSGKADIGISGISATKERQKVYDFSDTYYESVNVVIVKKSELVKYKKTNSLKGLSVATQKGTIQETVAKEQLTGAKIVSLVQNGEMINELKSGQVNGVVLEKPIAEGYVAKNDDLAIAQIKLKSSSSDAYAVAMPKGSSALKKKVDKVIKKLKKANKIDKFVKDAYNLSVSGGK
ncbi:transporter substrate-binding domain-containing protein [Streptococcus mutans]|uniref:transporter substrate-binding domain-containing protein n=1 Tax=Streptococcus mutans TaxID=1309 RepID=UPI0002B5243E|nr:transporter substrate-binding domain-containing protein [Streptococcus mutans]EMC39884.1 putative amino acid transporter, amino acid-binding protein [Streptococcus mutans 66-2A]MCB5015821.1 transporter substrate-binding domain-containing protein [Streptococcus mutans]MCB5116334.1 transporter substrate-binding domain-containing protein [Streptococcus mutans]